MPFPPRRSGSRQSRSRSASNISSHRNAAQQTSNPSSRRNSSARRRSTSPPRPASPRPRSPSPSLSRAPNQKRFGLNVPNLPRVPGKFDFEDKYPEDPIYEEMGPNARLWRAFLDEMEVFNMDMVTESRDGLDLLLVFAGLFSAVLSTFVAQTSQALSANFPAVSSSLLVEMVALQRAQINNTPIDDVLPANTAAGPSGFDVWVNALWFMSLTLSLGTALMAVLVKQWLYQYMAMISGTARDRSLVQFYRFEGLEKWHVRTIIGTLPIVLHIALGLFLAGLVIFLIPLNIPLACIVGFITLVVYVLYAVSNILPLIYIQCPYRTPFSDILNVMLRSARTLPPLAMRRIHQLLSTFGHAPTTIPGPEKHPEDTNASLKETERVAATDDEVAEEVTWRALPWMYQMTSNPPTKRIIQESLGCLSDDVSKRSIDIQADLEQALLEISPSTLDPETNRWVRLIPSGQERRAERILRAVRDPLAPRSRVTVPEAPWKLDATHSEMVFPTLVSILVHAPSITARVDSESWDFASLCIHLMNQQYSPTPIHLTPRLWILLISSISGQFLENSQFIEALCSFAVTTPTFTTIPAFAGPVTLGHRTVPMLQLVVDLLVHLRVPLAPDSFELQSPKQLFTIHDYSVSKANNLDLETTTGANYMSQIINVWVSMSRLDPLCDNDKLILCRRVETTILKMAINTGTPMEAEVYTNAIAVYNVHKLAKYSNGSGFFRKLLPDLSLSLTRGSSKLISHISKALQQFLNQPANAPVYVPLFCAAPFLSTRTLSSRQNYIDSLYPVVSTLVEAAGKVNRDIVLQSLFSEPRRFYTICWILTLGGTVEHYVDWEEHRRVTLLQLARIDPTHVVWESRAHYMSIDPRDWPYLRFLDKDLEDETLMAWARKRMREGLQILDRFLASPGTSPPIANQDAPPQNNMVPQSIPSSNPHWRHIRQLVSGTRALLGISSVSHSSQSDPTNVVELGLRREPSGAESAESDPHAEPGSRVPTSHSSRSSGASTAPSFRPRSSSTVSRPNHQLLLPALPCSASAIFLPQNTESNAVSAQPLEMERDEAEVSSGESPQLNVHSSIRKTATSPSAFSNDPVSTHPLEPSFPKEAENVEVMSGEPSHSHILATIQDTPPLPNPPSSDYLYSTTSDVVISASIQSPPPGSLTNMALQRPPSAGSLHSRHSTNLDVDDTTFAELSNSPELPTEII